MSKSLGLPVKGHLAKGLASGFPPCCIAYFTLRIWGMTNSPMIHRICSKKAYKEHKKYGEKIQHIMCPLHRLIHSRNNYENIPYYTCVRCGWYQYKDQTCNMCGSKCEADNVKAV